MYFCLLGQGGEFKCICNFIIYWPKCYLLFHVLLELEKQAKVIEESIDFKVGTYCGKSKHLKSHQDWEKEMEQYEVSLHDLFVNDIHYLISVICLRQKLRNS